MLCVSDALDAMDWIRTIGGIKKVEYLSNENFKVVQNWLDKSNWAENSVKTSILPRYSKYHAKIQNYNKGIEYLQFLCISPT